MTLLDNAVCFLEPGAVHQHDTRKLRAMPARVNPFQMKKLIVAVILIMILHACSSKTKAVGYQAFSKAKKNSL